MTASAFNYDESSDTLYISFEPGHSVTGIELNDHVLLRLNKEERKVIGLTLFDYSILAQPTEMGPRSFPLPGLSALPPDMRALVLNLLRTPPLSEIVALSAYTPSSTDTVPILSLRSTPLIAA